MSDQLDQPSEHPLRVLRKARGWTVEKLSNRSDVPQRTILGIETGGRRANPTTASKLSKALGVNPDAIQPPPSSDTHPLRVARLAMGLTIRELSKISGVSVYKIDLIELGRPKAPVDLTAATALEAALQVPARSIFSAKQPSIHPLRETRNAKGLTLHQLANLSGVNYATIQAIETWRDTRTSIWVAIELGRALAIDPSWLFDPSEIQNPLNNTTHPLRRVQEDCGWTIAALSEHSGVPADTIWKIEVYYPGFIPDDTTQILLSRALRVGVGHLFDPDQLLLSHRRPPTKKPPRKEVQCPGCNMLTIPGSNCVQCGKELVQKSPRQEGEI